MRHLGRKLYHILGGLGLLSLFFLLGRDRAFITYALLFCLVLAADVVRLKVPAVNRFVYARFGSFIRKNEEQKLTGTAPYILGIASSLYLYPAGIATAAVCFLACGDVAATTVGERYGRTKIGKKSLEGTLAFAAAAAAAGLLVPALAGVPIMHGLVLAGAIVAAGVELLPLPVNDNLVIPVVSGGAMWLLALATGCT
jgi:dolichol kinase